jgi:hypothetical protein
MDGRLKRVSLLFVLSLGCCAVAAIDCELAATAPREEGLTPPMGVRFTDPSGSGTLTLNNGSYTFRGTYTAGVTKVVVFLMRKGQQDISGNALMDPLTMTWSVTLNQIPAGADYVAQAVGTPSVSDTVPDITFK